MIKVKEAYSNFLGMYVCELRFTCNGKVLIEEFTPMNMEMNQDGNDEICGYYVDE